MPFSVQVTAMYRCIEADVFGAGGRITAHHIATAQITGAERRDARLGIVSAGVVDQAISLDPIAASQPGSVLWLQANQPLDVRLNSLSGAVISHVLLALLAASAALSALYVTNPGTTEAVLRVEVVGGGSLQASVPLP
jgi:hypothetical protein